TETIRQFFGLSLSKARWMARGMFKFGGADRIAEMEALGRWLGIPTERVDALISGPVLGALMAPTRADALAEALVELSLLRAATGASPSAPLRRATASHGGFV